MYCIVLHCIALHCIVLLSSLLLLLYICGDFTRNQDFKQPSLILDALKFRPWGADMYLSQILLWAIKRLLVWKSEWSEIQKKRQKNEPWSTTIDFHIGPLQGWVNTILHISGLSFQMFPTWPTPWNCINFSMLLENEISVGELKWLRPQRIFPYHPCQSRRLGSFVTKCGQMPLHGLHGLHGGSTVWRAHSCIFFWVSQALT